MALDNIVAYRMLYSSLEVMSGQVREDTELYRALMSAKRVLERRLESDTPSEDQLRFIMFPLGNQKGSDQ
jgi:hypothetical protein